MTDFNFLSADGSVNVTLRTDLVSAATDGTENLTVCEKIVVADPNKIFDNIQLKKYGVGELITFATDNVLKLTAYPIGKAGIPSGTNLKSVTLAAPTAFAATVDSATQISLAWTKSTGATGYTLQRATNSGFTTGLTTTLLGDVAVKVVTGLVTGTHYYFRIKATAPNADDSAYASDDDTTS